MEEETKIMEPVVDFKEVTIRDYHNGDEKKIACLFNTSDPRHSKSTLYWWWSNCDSFNADFLSAIAEDKGEGVGHYSLMGIDALTNRDCLRVGFGQQAVVHRKFRNLKIIFNLTKHIFQKARQKYKFLYAFPNDSFFPMHTALLDWKKVDIFAADVIRINDLELKENNNISVKQLDRFDEGVKNIVECNDKSCVFFQKDQKFLNWRFFSHPINYYLVYSAYVRNEIVGYLVLKVYYNNSFSNNNIGHFIDYEIKDSDIDIFNSLLRKAKEFFLFNDIEEVVFWNRHLRYKDLFTKYISKEKVGFSTNFAVLCLDTQDCDLPADINKWSFTMANSDAF